MLDYKHRAGGAEKASGGGSSRRCQTILASSISSSIPPLSALISTPPERKKGSEDHAIGGSRNRLSNQIHLADRGLGCPVRCILTAGRRATHPKPTPLLRGYSPMSSWLIQSTMPTTSGRSSPTRARSPSSQTILRAHASIRSTSTFMPSDTSSNAASASSCSSAVSQRARKKSLATISPSSLSLPSLYGSDNCPQNLASV